jgi:hypothetical protein
MYVARNGEASDSLLDGEEETNTKRRNRARTKPTFTATCLSWWQMEMVVWSQEGRIDSWQAKAGCSWRDWQEAGTASLLRAKPGAANDGAFGDGKEAELCASVAGVVCAWAWVGKKESGCAAGESRVGVFKTIGGSRAAKVLANSSTQMVIRRWA